MHATENRSTARRLENSGPVVAAERETGSRVLAVHLWWDNEDVNDAFSLRIFSPVPYQGLYHGLGTRRTQRCFPPVISTIYAKSSFHQQIDHCAGFRVMQ